MYCEDQRGFIKLIFYIVFVLAVILLYVYLFIRDNNRFKLILSITAGIYFTTLIFVTMLKIDYLISCGDKIVIKERDNKNEL